jgi:chromosomal replication initiator protein
METLIKSDKINTSSIDINALMVELQNTSEKFIETVEKNGEIPEKKVKFEICVEVLDIEREYILELLSTLRNDSKSVGAKMDVISVIHDPKNEMTIERITGVVFGYLGISIDLLNSKSRKRELVQARQIAMYFARLKTKYSLSVIGSEVGSKDHATVLAACDRVNELVETNWYNEDTRVKYRDIIDGIEKRLK